MASYGRNRRRRPLPRGAGGTGGAAVPGSRYVTSRRQQPKRPPGRTAPRAQTPQNFTPQVAPVASDIPLLTSALSGGTGTYDPSSDPAVAAAAGLSAKIRAQAQATALAKRKQAAIEYGDPTGVEGVDEQTAKAARENPYSVLKNLERSYETGKGELEEGLNQANLFYSGYRGKQLGEASTRYQQTRYDAGSAFRGLMGDIGDQLAQALLQADELDYQALLNSQGGYYDPGGGGGEDGGDGGSDLDWYRLPAGYDPGALPKIRGTVQGALRRAYPKARGRSRRGGGGRSYRS